MSNWPWNSIWFVLAGESRYKPEIQLWESLHWSILSRLLLWSICPRGLKSATNAHVFASQTIRGCINYHPTWWSSHHWECWWSGGWILQSSARSTHHEEEPPVQMLNMISWSSSSLKREVMIDPLFKSRSAKLSFSSYWWSKASGRPDPRGEVRWSEEYAWPTQRGRQVGAPQQIWISPEKKYPSNTCYISVWKYLFNVIGICITVFTFHKDMYSVYHTSYIVYRISPPVYRRLRWGIVPSPVCHKFFPPQGSDLKMFNKMVQISLEMVQMSIKWWKSQ